VAEQEFVDELIKSGKFKNEDESRRFIRKMNQEGSIYESTPGHYNTV
jgi:polyhydroxyalkanoate synthesis regulator phasin